MASLLAFFRDCIKDEFIPPDQRWMSESFLINGVTTTMHCEICPEKKDQDYLLTSFDKKSDNSMLFSYFKPYEGLVCMCDYILFVETSDSLTVASIELKHHSGSPEQQACFTIPFARFLIERMRMVNPSLFEGKDIQYRGIGIKASYKSRRFIQGYRMEFDDKGYALLPNPQKMYLTMVCKP